MMRQTDFSQVDFIDFVDVWNKGQNLTTPKVHKKIISFLKDAWISGEKKSILMAFRGCGKSTMVGLFCAWLLLRNPNLRIMVLSAEGDLARRMVRTVKRIIESHMLTKNLKPKRAEQWSGECFTVNRDMQLREASMQAEGILGNITGSRADIIICDDVEVPNTSGTAVKRESLRSRLNEVDYILVPNGLQLYVGTPHSFYSIYNKQQQGEVIPFLNGFKRLEIPLVNKNGKSAWLERYSLETIEDLRLRHGKQKFNAQMQLQCVNPKESRLNADKAIVYQANLEKNFSNGNVHLDINGVNMLSASAVWDPAYGLDRGDQSIIACVFTGEDGRYYLHDLKVIEVDECSDIDTARQQCLQVSDFIVKNNLPSVHIEKNGIGAFLPSLLKSVLAEKKVRASVLDYHNKDSKNSRIIRSYDALLDAGHLCVHSCVVDAGFLEQISDFNPMYKNNKDDMIDAVAGCLTFEPVRLNTYNTGKSVSTWSRGINSTMSQKNFDVWG